MGRYFLSLIAALTLEATSGGMVAILCAVLACSAPLAITSASSLPSMTALQPGIRSPHLSTFALVSLLSPVSPEPRTPLAGRSWGTWPCDQYERDSNRVNVGLPAPGARPGVGRRHGILAGS